MNFKHVLTILFFLFIPVFTFATEIQENFDIQCGAQQMCLVKHFSGLNSFNLAWINVENCNQSTILSLILFKNDQGIWSDGTDCYQANPYSTTIDLTAQDVDFYIQNQSDFDLTITGYIDYTPLGGSQTTTTFSDFVKNDFLPETGQIISDVFIPLLILTIGVAFAIIFLKPFITFIKDFFK